MYANGANDNIWVELAGGTLIPLSSVQRFFIRESEGGFQRWVSSFALQQPDGLDHEALVSDFEYKTRGGAARAQLALLTKLYANPNTAADQPA